MKSTNYNIRLNPDVKSQAEKTFAEFGLNLSEAINVFLHMAIKHRGFPFEIRAPKLNNETLRAIQETEQIIAEYDAGSRTPKLFANAREMFDAMALENETGDGE